MSDTPEKTISILVDTRVVLAYERQIAEAVAAEREACAALIEGYVTVGLAQNCRCERCELCRVMAAKIRARSDTT